jgi:hypothetical protein
VLDECNRSLLFMEMKAESVDSCKRDVIVDDSVEAEKRAFAEGGTTEVAAFNLAFCSFGWEPGLLGGLWRSFRRR